MALLALDLGTSCGFAIFKDGKFASGTKKLRVDKRAFGSRFLDFRNWLLQIIALHDVREIYFERVYGHTGTEAAHVYGGLMYTLATVCLELNLKCVGFSVQMIKKFMTGKGNATKEEMISAAKSRGFNPKTHDEADAVAIMLLALSFLTLNNKSTVHTSKSGSFRPLIERGSLSPETFLASELFSEVDPELNYSIMRNGKNAEK